MGSPKVSICIPAFRRAEGILRVLESVFRQTFRDFEVIITDDSPDESVEKAVNQFSRYSNLHFYKNPQKRGSPENWNESVRRASGDYIKLLHDDDWFADENSLAAFVQMLDQNPEADFAFCPSLNCDPTQQLRFVHTPTATQILSLRANPRVLFFGNFIGSPSATIYRKAVNKRFDSRLKWLVDIDFYVRVLGDNRVFSVSNRPLVCITIESPEQVTAECVNNKSVEVFEWLYFYGRICSDEPLDYGRLKAVWYLFDRYDVRTRQDIVNCGVDFPLPRSVDSILLARTIYRIVRRVGTCSKRAVLVPYRKSRSLLSERRP